MTPTELIAARRALGMKAIDLGRALELEGKDPGRSVRAWEAGAPMPGPARVAVRLMLAEKAREGLERALEAAGAKEAATTAHAVAKALQADREGRAAQDMPPVPRAMTELMTLRPATRRRG